MTLVDRTLRRQLTAAMALAMALALLLSGTALAQTPDAVEIDTACEGAPEAGFDDIEGTTFEDEINCLAWYEITQGVGNGDGYAPLDGVRRWQMALFIYRLAAFADEQLDSIDLPEPSDQGFNDIDELSEEAQNAVNILAEIGVVNGKNATTFDPFPIIRRDQMASFINRLQEYLAGDGFSSDGNVFDDVPSDNVHRQNINALANAGIVQGKGNDRYDPSGPVTRGQMAAFIMRYVQVNVDDGLLEPKSDEPVPGEVTLDADQVEAGGSVTGSVEDPGTVDSIAVSGCGFSNDTVELDGEGDFTLTIPAGQEPGSCDLTFTVLRTDDTSTETVIPFAVTAIPQQFTDSPDLVSASINADDNAVTYVFDEAADGATPDADDFRIYDAETGFDGAATVEILAGDSKQVVADFTGAAIDVEDATLATIRDDAVEDAAGNAAYASAAALSPQDLVAGRTNTPDLETVNNIRTDGGAIVADFRFDEEVEAYGGLAFPATPFVAVGDFFLYTADGSSFASTDVVGRSADNRTLTVEFGPAPVGFATSQVTRGVVEEAVVATGVGDPDNPTQTEPRTGAPDFTLGATADRTDEPDLVSVKVVGDDTVAFEFDEAVDTTPVFGDFFVYNNNGVETAGTAGVRSSTNANVVNVTIAPAAVAAAVGASVDVGAVNAVGDAEANLIHELPLQDVSFSAGRTGFPDLVSVDISLDAFGDADVVYTFDANPPAALVAADFALVDAQGARFTPGGPGVIDNDDDTVTFDGGVSVFENSEAAAAVIGSVQDESAVLPVGAIITEGDVTVGRDTALAP